MGGCCFTPRKTQLLWWYWLLLFSVVGIPMFAAALYVQRASGRGILDRRDVRRASCLFWLGTGLSLLLAGLLLVVILTYIGLMQTLENCRHIPVLRWFGKQLLAVCRKPA